MLKLGRQLIKLNDGFVKGFFIVGFNRQFQQARDVFAALLQLIDGFNDGFKRCALFTQRLCALGFVPNVRLFQLCVNFF
ncbi:hypothetical protein M2406_004742 [Serratia sp. BIGb0163]|nr:hypothetical protein [Serratia sp. BIGb0163]